MYALYHAVLYQPLYNLLIWLYNVIPGQDIGLAIIALTIVIRLVLYPLSQRALKSQKALQKLQPELEALRKEHKDDQQRQAKEMMALYAREKVHPLSSCLPVLIQLPIFIALYHVLQSGLKSEGFGDLYPFVSNPGTIKEVFLGIVNLGEPSKVFAILSGAAQFVQAKQMIMTRPPKVVRDGEPAKDEDTMAIMNKQMMYMMPVMTVVIGWNLPGGLALYWLVSTLIQVLQQFIAFRDVPKQVEHVDPSQISTP